MPFAVVRSVKHFVNKKRVLAVQQSVMVGKMGIWIDWMKKIFFT